MSILVCPDKFRGSLTASEAAAEIAAGLQHAGCTHVLEVPLADGGEGTSDVLLETVGGVRCEVETTDALGCPLTSNWVALADGTAVVESAATIGLALVADRNDALAATSTGLGHVLDLVLATRPRRLFVTVGGTATTDGGRGVVDALGRSLRGTPTTVLCDVSTRFLDAATVFAPQKGANPEQVHLLSARLQALAVEYARDLTDIRPVPGGGAGGGLAGGLAALGARLRPGFEVVAEFVGLPRHLAVASFVVTGEGRLDATSLEGKVVGSVLAHARQHLAVVVGSADPTVARDLRVSGVDVSVLTELTDADTFANARQLVREAAYNLGRAYRQALARVDRDSSGTVSSC